MTSFLSRTRRQARRIAQVTTPQENDCPSERYSPACLDLLVQLGLALAIFPHMISAASGLPASSRLGLDPSNPTIRTNYSSLTQDVRKYMTVLTGVELTGRLGGYHLPVDLGSGLRGAVGATRLVHGLYPLDWLYDCLDPTGASGVRSVRLANRRHCPDRIYSDQWWDTKLLPAQGDGAKAKDFSGGRFCRLVYLEISCWEANRVNPGGAAHPAGADHDGEFRRHSPDRDPVPLHREEKKEERERRAAKNHVKGL